MVVGVAIGEMGEIGELKTTIVGVALGVGSIAGVGVKLDCLGGIF